MTSTFVFTLALPPAVPGFDRGVLRPLKPVYARDFIRIAPHEVYYEEFKTSQQTLLRALSLEINIFPPTKLLRQRSGNETSLGLGRMYLAVSCYPVLLVLYYPSALYLAALMFNNSVDPDCASRRPTIATALMYTQSLAEFDCAFDHRYLPQANNHETCFEESEESRWILLATFSGDIGEGGAGEKDVGLCLASTPPPLLVPAEWIWEVVVDDVWWMLRLAMRQHEMLVSTPGGYR
ncbi:unnamed protein product [Peniophora sp. CBMAI 1063]|nr:unnamed protein product [Peniophora sp. CBMAI 1063]